MGIVTPEMIAAYNKAGPVHKVVDLAFDGCFEHSEYDLSFAGGLPGCDARR